MLKHGEVNPLNVFGLRQLTHCPPHFEQVQFDLSCGEKDITDWIYENLQGRFYIGQHAVVRPPNEANKPTFVKTVVAFENVSEASYFSLFLPQINQAKVFW
jgi:alpha-ketoglutarate-dependent taurine dioxygenase